MVLFRPCPLKILLGLVHHLPLGDELDLPVVWDLDWLVLQLLLAGQEGGGQAQPSAQLPNLYNSL